jgi:calcineurin-like phosphoesterase family protein
MKLLKFNNPNINHWITSDLHLNHNKEFLYGKRGFNNIEEHNETVLNNINNLVKPDDILFSLGDFCLTTPEDKFEELINKINCKNIYLIWGNHPNPIKKIYYKEVEKLYGPDIDVYPFRYKNIIFVGYHLECIIQGKYVVLNHFPIEVWENMKEGSYMLCGHSHYSLHRTRKDSVDGLTLDCGWEGHNSIYNFNEIVSIMKTKTIRAIDHHKK